MSAITERAYNIASAAYPPSDERHLFIKDMVEDAQQKAVTEAAPNVDRLVEAVHQLALTGQFRDVALLRAYRTAYAANVTTGKVARDSTIPSRAAVRALVLAALGIEEAAQ